MIASILKKIKKKRLYIKLFQNSIEIYDLGTKKTYQSESTIPFNNDRSLIAYFNKAVAFYKVIFLKNDLINYNT